MTTSATNRIAFIGGGNMAYALATRLAATQSAQIIVAEPSADRRACFGAAVATTTNNVEAVHGANVVVLAVKPQVVETVARQVGAALDAQALVVSIAAGVPLNAIERWLGGTRAVVRCMPNTPALVGAGISGLVANAATSALQRRATEDILRAVGDVAWFEAEADLDAVTALSGSGPAYFFYMVEALAEAGTALGLTPEVAKRLVVATAAGAAAMAAEDDPARLREQVTSPGGTTQRALSILAERAFPETLAAAVRGAFERSRQLAQEIASDA